MHKLTKFIAPFLVHLNQSEFRFLPVFFNSYYIYLKWTKPWYSLFDNRPVKSVIYFLRGEYDWRFPQLKKQTFSRAWIFHFESKPEVNEDVLYNYSNVSKSDAALIDWRDDAINSDEKQYLWIDRKKNFSSGTFLVFQIHDAQ